MANLDNINAMKELDRENILGNIQDLPDQVEKCWEDWKKVAVPTSFITAKSVLILGMGGSAQGGGIVASLARESSNIPIYILKDYDIPGWVDKNTLVIAASYSGNTEETISALMQAVKKTDKIITISTGGKVYSIGSQNKALHYRIHYGSQPRAAIGYGLTSIMAIFKKLGLLEITDDDIREAVLLMRALRKKLDVEIPERRNSAKMIAGKIFGKIPIVWGAGNLSEVAYRIKGQFNENAKSVSYNEIWPELNHNALLGLDYPNDLKQKIFFLVLVSKYNHPRTLLRENIMTQILQQKKLNYETIMLQPAGNPVAEMWQILYYGDYISYYLAMLNNVAPEPIEIINFLKNKLAEVPMEEK